MNYFSDTITAISTPTGFGAISVIRISGDKAVEVVDEFISNRDLKTMKSNLVKIGKFKVNDTLLDEVMVTVFRKPHSYTGENLVEISCHGNPFITQKIVESLLMKSRLAEKGEFTQRAFFNNKMDLTQAEAVGDLLNAKTKFSHLAAMEQLEGKLYHRIQSLLRDITSIRSLIELEIDFIEQDLPEISLLEIKEKLIVLLQNIRKLCASGEEGMILRDGLKVSLVGAPNVGKSSIFNAFLQTERAIVTPQPGTTRDYLEEAVALQGYLIRLYDTAGLRQTNDIAEKKGIERSYDIIKQSHKVLFIIDGTENNADLEELKTFIESEKIMLVLNKSDLFSEHQLESFQGKGYVICSTQTETGLDTLKQCLLAEISINEADLQAGMLVNARQIAAVSKAVTSLEKAIQSIDEELGYEFTAFDLKESSEALEEVIGKVTDDDVLNHIFENFCIGK
jgi:tRNA modification GTPase